MKFIFCTCSISMSDRLITLLEGQKVKHYQVADNVIASSIVGSPRFNTAVWPGYNAIICAQVRDDKKAENVIDEISTLNRESAQNDDELITVCSWGMDSFIYEK